LILVNAKSTVFVIGEKHFPPLAGIRHNVLAIERFAK